MALMSVTNKNTNKSWEIKVTNNGTKGENLQNGHTYTRTNAGTAFDDQTGVVYKSDMNGNITDSNGNLFKINFVQRA